MNPTASSLQRTERLTRTLPVSGSASVGLRRSTLPGSMPSSRPATAMDLPPAIVTPRDDGGFAPPDATAGGGAGAGAGVAALVTPPQEAQLGLLSPGVPTRSPGASPSRSRIKLQDALASGQARPACPADADMSQTATRRASASISDAYRGRPLSESLSVPRTADERRRSLSPRAEHMSRPRLASLNPTQHMGPSPEPTPRTTAHRRSLPEIGATLGSGFVQLPSGSPAGTAGGGAGAAGHGLKGAASRGGGGGLEISAFNGMVRSLSPPLAAGTYGDRPRTAPSQHGGSGR